ncbi:MAG: hypothetical protein RLY97_1785 [Pseudomonadota bacterium]
MIASLPLFHRIAGCNVIVLGDGEAAEAKRRLVERAGGVVVGADRLDARLAFVAYDDAGDGEMAVAALRARGLLVNCVDRPDLCDFTTPSILDRSPVLIAIGTGGASAGLAKAVRLRLEAILPAGLGALADGLAAARGALRGRWANAGERRRALDEALAAGGVLDPLDEMSVGRIAAWLAGAVDSAGRVVDIHLSSDDPDDLTLRQARLLGSADVVAYEVGIAPAILNRARADARRVMLEKGAIAEHCNGLHVILRR